MFASQIDGKMPNQGVELRDMVKELNKKTWKLRDMGKELNLETWKRSWNVKIALD